MAALAELCPQDNAQVRKKLLMLGQDRTRQTRQTDKTEQLPEDYTRHLLRGVSSVLLDRHASYIAWNTSVIFIGMNELS